MNIGINLFSLNNLIKKNNILIKYIVNIITYVIIFLILISILLSIYDLCSHLNTFDMLTNMLPSGNKNDNVPMDPVKWGPSLEQVAKETNDDQINNFASEIVKEADLSKVESIVNEISGNGFLPFSKYELKELNEIIKNNTMNAEDNSILQQILSEAKAKFVETEESIEVVNNTINSHLNKFSSDDIFYLLDSFKNDISHLSNEQLFSLIHVFFFIALFIAVINLALVFYGDSLIIKLNLENKFPKLASIIRFRRKFQQYYFGWNFFIIISVLSVLFYFNLLVFLT